MHPLNSESKLYGGRALTNGVLMAGPGSMAVSIRRGDGTIATETDTFVPPLIWARRIPLLRGLLAMLSAVILAFRAARLQRRLAIDRSKAARGKQALSMIIPALIASLLDRVLQSRRDGHARRRSYFSSMLQALAPLLGFRLSAFLPTGSALLRYHAAEHMAVNAVESTGVASVANAQAQSRIHPRCGTSLGLLAMLLTNVFGRRKKRGPLGSLVGGALAISISYEILRFGSEHRAEPRIKRVFAPLWNAQLLTTSPPSKDEIEVACAALSAVISAEAGEAPVSPEIV